MLNLHTTSLLILSYVNLLPDRQLDIGVSMISNNHTIVAFVTNNKSLQKKKLPNM